MGPRPDLSFCACKTAWLAPEILVCMGPSPHLWFLHAKQRPLDRNYKSLWVPDPTCDFSMQNSDFLTRITSLYGSQMWPVVLYMYNSVLRIRNTRSKPSSVFFVCKTAVFGPELQVSMGPRPLSTYLWFCACKTATLGPELQVSMGPWPHLSFCACKTVWLAPESLVSMGSSPHLWFWAFKTASLEPKLHVSIGARPHLWFCACKTECLASQLPVSMGSSPHLWYLDAKKKRLSDQNYKSLWVPDLTCRFVHAKQHD